MKSFTFGLAMVELVMVILAIRAGIQQQATGPAAECASRVLGAGIEPSACAKTATGVTVSEDRRVFVSFPARNPVVDGALAEVGPDGSVRPYPDQGWNAWGLKAALDPTEHFVCVQSVVCDEQGGLWALDTGSLGDEQVAGAMKLVKIDLGTDTVERVYAFRDDVAWRDSRFTDMRIDHARQAAYITDAGAGGLVMLDLATGRAHRLPRNEVVSESKRDFLTDLGLRTPGR